MKISWVRIAALVIGAAMSVSVGLATPGATAAAPLIYGNGKICSNSSSTLVVTAKVGVDWFGNGGKWEVRQVGPNQCLGGRGSGNDVDVVWGATCDPRGRCQLQSRKLGEGSFTTWNATDVHAPYRPMVAINGGADWSRDPQWPAPDVNNVRYTLIVR